MKLRTLAAASTVAAFLAACAPPVAADTSMQCDVYQRQVLRVALSLAAGQTALDRSVITRVVEQIWAPEGLDFEWIDETAAAGEDRLDAWVVVGRQTSEDGDVPAREDGLTRRVVRVSGDEVMAHLEQSLSLRLQVTRESAHHLMFGGHAIERSLGYAIAHKLGHSVMGLPHATAGLMSSGYDTAPGLKDISPAQQLDAESRRLVQKRFAVGCVTR